MRKQFELFFSQIRQPVPPCILGSGKETHMATIVGRRSVVFLVCLILCALCFQAPVFAATEDSCRHSLWGGFSSGVCLFRCEDDRFVIELKNCPVSQLVAQWNRIAKDKLVEPPGNIPLLKVIGDRCHDELDMTLDIKRELP
jgi:hypothetical protein